MELSCVICVEEKKGILVGKDEVELLFSLGILVCCRNLFIIHPGIFHPSPQHSFHFQERGKKCNSSQVQQKKLQWRIKEGEIKISSWNNICYSPLLAFLGI